MSAVTDLKLTGERVANQPDQMKLSGTANFDTAGPKPFVVTIMARGDEVQVVDVVFNE